MADVQEERQQALHDALETFETSLETPFVPGELERWISEVDRAWLGLKPELSWLLTTKHPEEYAEIGEEDQELFQRVEQMRAEDAAIEQRIEETARQIPALASAIDRVEPDEDKLAVALENFVEKSLDLVIRIRKQEQSVRVWLLEAFTRDRGTVD